ncbi:MAG: amidase [Rhodopseudomonas sp.]|nr:amidase [Rhodopseudomonas sp.]
MTENRQVPEPATGPNHRAAIQSWESKVGAWAYIDPLAVARNGTFLGVKDVIDVCGMRTRAGSETRRDITPASADATIVRRLRNADFIPLGKTVTTEFAFVDPAATRNPYALMHSPGGSSSGSAAAVAAGMVPVALGTQTAGSLCRPAAYCGVAAIKPSYGLLPTDGVVPLSPSFDTPGVMARHVGLAAQALAVMAALPSLANGEPAGRMKLAYLPDRYSANSSADVRDFHHRTIAKLTRAGIFVERAKFDIDFAAVIQDHRTVMLWEAYAAHGSLLKSHANLLKPLFHDALLFAATLIESDAVAAAQRLTAARQQAWDQLKDFDAVILQPTPSAAPRGFATTGDQSYQTPWTAFHGPLVTVPGELNGDGLPLAVMLAGRPGSDRKTIAMARVIQSMIDRVPSMAPL